MFWIWGVVGFSTSRRNFCCLCFCKAEFLVILGYCEFLACCGISGLGLDGCFNFGWCFEFWCWFDCCFVVVVLVVSAERVVLHGGGFGNLRVYGFSYLVGFGFCATCCLVSFCLFSTGCLLGLAIYLLVFLDLVFW